MVDAYYNNQLSYYSGIPRQRGSGFGALALGIGRTILPLARMGFKKLAPIALSAGKEILKDIAPELLDSLISKRKPRRRVLADSAVKAMKKQIGSGRGRTMITPQKSRGQKRKKISRSRKPSKRSRVSFFSNVRDD